MNIAQAAAFSEISKVLANYDLGELVHQEQNLLGYNNANFSIQTTIEGARHDFFFRRYKLGIQPEEIQFEHAVINHLVDQEFDLVAGIHQTKGGESCFVRLAEDATSEPTYYAVFDYLSGEDKYSWIDPRLSLDELHNSAAVLAQFHNAVADFTPPGRRIEPKICELQSQIVTYLETCLQRSKGSSFDELLAENHGSLMDSISGMRLKCADIQRLGMVQLVIHCDFHPGNLKFRDQQVVGLFDFDWSKIDLRSFDVGLALWYFFTDWKGPQAGKMRLNECQHFLKTYQTTLQKLPDLLPLTQTEKQVLPEMINLGNMFVLFWTLTDYFSNPVDEDEYRFYLQHHINFNRWYANGGQRLLETELLLR